MRTSVVRDRLVDACANTRHSLFRKIPVSTGYFEVYISPSTSMLRRGGLPHMCPKLFPSTLVQISYSLIILLFNKKNSSWDAEFSKWCGALLRNVDNYEMTQRNVPERYNLHQNRFQNLKLRKMVCLKSNNKSHDHGYTHLGRHVAVATKFFMMTTNISESSVWNALNVFQLNQPTRCSKFSSLLLVI
jgi:hypothetical protein